MYYIPSPDYLISMYVNPCFNGRWVIEKKVPLSNIKIDKSLFSFQNEVNPKEIEWICNEFHLDAWYPVIVNSNKFLLDGQHRLAAAKKMKLKYIDVVIDNGENEQEIKMTIKKKSIKL